MIRRNSNIAFFLQELNEQVKNQGDQNYWLTYR